jgi:hypothetical protein
MTIAGAVITPQLAVFAMAGAAALIAGLLPDMSYWPGAAMATFGNTQVGSNPGMDGGFKRVIR